VFQLGKYELALNRYKKIIRYLASETNAAGDSQDSVRSLLLAAHLNMALCHLKLRDEVQARDCCNSALELDPRSVKGLYRRGLVKLVFLSSVISYSSFAFVVPMPLHQSSQCQFSAWS
jgi:FK506-binding protein 4/5